MLKRMILKSANMAPVHGTFTKFSKKYRPSGITKTAGRDSSLSPEIYNLLNEQVTHEINNAQSYLAASSWCMDNGFLNSAAFFKKQAADERDHQLMVIKYIEDRNGLVNIGTIPEPRIKTANIKSLLNLYESAYALEKNTTAYLEAISKTARAQGDYLTETWNIEMLKEQIAEENEAADRVAMLKAAAGNPSADYMFDQLSMKQYL